MAMHSDERARVFVAASLMAYSVSPPVLLATGGLTPRRSPLIEQDVPCQSTRWTISPTIEQLLTIKLRVLIYRP
jgi:hypothetical protein